MILRCCGTTHYMAQLYNHDKTSPPNHVRTYQLLFKNQIFIISCYFSFRTPELLQYVIVKTYGDILRPSVVSAPALLPVHCIFFALVNSNSVSFISAHAALIGTAHLCNFSDGLCLQPSLWRLFVFSSVRTTQLDRLLPSLRALLINCISAYTGTFALRWTQKYVVNPKQGRKGDDVMKTK